jgi:hypothetical protein
MRIADMIVIKAAGGPGVKALKKLAQSLSAEDREISSDDQIGAAPLRSARRASNRPSVSTLPGAMVSAQTQAAIQRLQPVEVSRSGEYELS